MPGSFIYLKALAKSLQSNANWLAVAGAARGVVDITGPSLSQTLRLSNTIAEDYQHRGLARELVDMVRDRNEGKTLVVHAAEKVIPFYEKLGFELDGEMNRESFPYCPMKLSGREKQQEIIQEHSLFEK